jgi:hypothetical protein
MRGSGGYERVLGLVRTSEEWRVRGWMSRCSSLLEGCGTYFGVGVLRGNVRYPERIQIFVTNCGLS